MDDIQQQGAKNREPTTAGMPTTATMPTTAEMPKRWKKLGLPFSEEKKFRGTRRRRKFDSFRRNSVCSAKRKMLGIPFRVIPRKVKKLGIPFRTICRREIHSEFRSEPLSHGLINYVDIKANSVIYKI